MPHDSAPGCAPEEVALKSFFLGPQAENAPWLEERVHSILQGWFQWRKSLYPGDGRAIPASDQEMAEFRARVGKVDRLLGELTTRFEEELPKFSPRYIGHMFSEVSMPALLGHIVTLLHNPNNLAGESSRVGVKIEREAIGFLAGMVGFSATSAWGHFTSGGTIANFEAMVRARSRLLSWLAAGAAARDGKKWTRGLFESAHMGWEQFGRLEISREEMSRWDPSVLGFYDASSRYKRLFGTEFRGPVILVPKNCHYSWQKGVSHLGLGQENLWPIELDRRGRLSVSNLREQLDSARLAGRPVLMVVSVAGTTELGGIDPVHEVQDVLENWEQREGIHIWHHVDAAYGGFFRSMLRTPQPQEAFALSDAFPLSDQCAAALQAMGRVSSVTLDPHKLGYVPYASGAFLARTEKDYFNSSCDAPYLDLKSKADPAPQTLEGSRSAAGAVATWLTARSIGLDRDGYGRILMRTIRSARALEEELARSNPRIRVLPALDTNICCFCMAVDGERLSASNRRTLEIYSEFSSRKNGNFFVSKTQLKWQSYTELLKEFTGSWDPELDEDHLVVIRLCLMNPFFSSIETKFQYPEEFVRTVAALAQSQGETSVKT